MAVEPVLKLEKVTKHFPVTKGIVLEREIGRVHAVNGIDLELMPGKTLALVGESGCGKSTTVKLILRQEKPTAGRVLVGDKDVHQLTGDSLRQFRVDVQAVFQDPWSSLNPRMRVFDIVSEALVVNHRVNSAEVASKVAQVLTAVGLRPEQGRNFPHEFSGGQRQRIAIASALISDPKILVLDEPVSALDVSIRSQIMNLFKDLQEKFGLSYILVAHDLGTTRYMADDVAVMYLGKIVETAPTRELFASPLHPYTKALFSAALPSHPDTDRDEIVLEGEVPSPIEPPTGCSFHPRCPMMIGDICRRSTPVLASPKAGAGRKVACHLHPPATSAEDCGEEYAG